MNSPRVTDSERYEGPLSAKALSMLQHLLQQGIVTPENKHRQESLFDNPLPARDNLQAAPPAHLDLEVDPLVDVAPQAEERLDSSVSMVHPDGPAPDYPKKPAKFKNWQVPDFRVRYEQWRKVPFSRESYYKEVRGNALGGMLLSTGLSLCLAGGIVGGTVIYLLPKRDELLTRKTELERLPADISKVQVDIKSATARLNQTERDANQALEGLPEPAVVFGAYSQFLHNLEANRVSLRKQLLSTTPSETNPLTLSPADAAPVPGPVAAKPNAQVATPAGGSPASSPAAPNAGKSAAKPGPQPVQASPLAASMQYGPGLNYYHFVIDIEGPYLAYLAARQELVNALPALVVHHERVTSVPERPQGVAVTIKASIPFMGKPK